MISKLADRWEGGVCCYWKVLRNGIAEPIYLVVEVLHGPEGTILV